MTHAPSPGDSSFPTAPAQPAAPDEVVEVRKNDAVGAFELLLDGAVVGVAEYYDEDGLREFPSTEVDPALRGRGLAGRLVGYALQQTRAEGLQVAPLCPYVATYIRRHQQYADLLES